MVANNRRQEMRRLGALLAWRDLRRYGASARRARARRTYHRIVTDRP
jgi:hypothetical protein